MACLSFSNSQHRAERAPLRGLTSSLRLKSGAPHRGNSMKRSRRSGYWVFLLPSAVLFTAVIVVPFLMNVGIGFTRWQGIGAPKWIGLDNYTRLLADERFWASFRNHVALIVAMAIIPTISGLVLVA